MRVLSVLKERNFRNFFLADIISMFGTGMSFIGANWFVLKYTGSSSSVGLLIALNFVGSLVVFPIAGTIADRFDRRAIIFWSNFVRAIIAIIVAVTIFTDRFHIGYLYFLGALSGAGWTVFLPASRGLVQELLGKRDLIKGNSLIEVSMQVGMFVAGAGAGFIYKYCGFGVILAIDAATFLFGSVFLLFIKYTPHIAHDREDSFSRRFKNGLGYLTQNPIIFIFGIVIFLPFVATMSSNAVTPAYISDHLGKDSVVFGFTDMSYGMGACLSGFIAAWLAAKFSRLRVIVGFFVVSIGFYLFLVFNQFVTGLFLASFFIGLANSSLRIIMNTILMEIVPKSYIGRAMSVWMAISTILQILSAYGLGMMVDRVPSPYGFGCLAGIMIIGLVFGVIFLEKLREMSNFQEDSA